MRKLSDIVAYGSKAEIINNEELRYNTQICSVVDIIEKQGLHLVLLAGPSGSGKTTTATRLQERLASDGRKAYVLSMDNWYKTRSRDDIPRDSNGNIDYESPDCIDLDLLNSDIKNLLQKKKVEIPHFDFANQKMVYNGDTLQLQSDTDILIIEGIHALNSCIDVSDGVRLYISPSDLLINDREILTGRQLRLFRRIVRDSKHRGMSAEATIAKLPSVTRGEKLYIEPNKKNIDIEIDSLIGYELFIHERELQGFKEVEHILRYIYELDVDEITEMDIPTGSILEEFYR